MAESNVIQAQATWVAGLQFVGSASGSNVAIVMDGVPEQGGSGSGIRPMEALLVSLAGCTGMDVISVLQKKRQRVTGFRLNVLGTRAEEHPRSYVHIAIEFVVRGWNIAEEAVRRSIELSQTKYCGVTASLRAEIVYTYRIEQEQTPGQD